MAKTWFGKLFKGVGKAAKFVATVGAGVLGVQLPISATNAGIMSAPSMTAPADINGGMLPEVTVTAIAPTGADKPIGQKLIDLLDVASGNRPFITDVGVSESVIPKWAIPVGLGIAGLFVAKKVFKF